jgi:hypothetical protein
MNYSLYVCILVVVVSAAGCSGSDKNSSQVIQPTIATSIIPLEPAHMFGGSTVQVWVYKDASVESPYCGGLVEEMLPAEAAGQIDGRLATCEVLGPEALYLHVLKDSSGNLFLDRVSIVLLAGLDFPTPSLPTPGAAVAKQCDEITKFLLTENEDPATAAWRSACEIQPLVRGATTDPLRTVWATIPVESTIDPTASPVPCWTLPRYINRVTTDAVKDVKCRL